MKDCDRIADVFFSWFHFAYFVDYFVDSEHKLSRRKWIYRLSEVLYKKQLDENIKAPFPWIKRIFPFTASFNSQTSKANLYETEQCPLLEISGLYEKSWL